MFSHINRQIIIIYSLRSSILIAPHIYVTPKKVRIFNKFRKINKLKTDNAALLEDVNRMKPKEVFADAVSASKASILVGELAKILKQNGYETGEKRLFARLRKDSYLISRKGTDYNMPTQKSMKLGLFEIKETAITHSDGHITISYVTAYPV